MQAQFALDVIGFVFKHADAVVGGFGSLPVTGDGSLEEIGKLASALAHHTHMFLQGLDR